MRFEPDSGFQWSRLQEQPVDHPPSKSTYVEALEELINALRARPPAQRRTRGPPFARNGRGRLPIT